MQSEQKTGRNRKRYMERLTRKERGQNRGTGYRDKGNYTERRNRRREAETLETTNREGQREARQRERRE